MAVSMGVEAKSLNRSQVAGVAILFVALLVATAVSYVDRAFAVFWLFGLAFGMILQRSRFCFASAFRDLFLLQQGRVMRAILAGMAVGTLGFTLVMSNLVPNPALGLLPPDAHVVPLGWHLVVGGVLFGLGMVLAGGCVSGSLYRMGEGYVGSWVAMGGILVGLWGASQTWNWWWQVHISRQPVVWLPRYLGYGGAVGLTLLVLGALYLLALWWEARSGIVFPEPPTLAAGFTFGERLNALYHVIFVRAWPVALAGLGLGALNVFEYAYRHPWGVTGELARWANALAGLVGLSAGPLLGVDQIAGCSLAMESGLLTHGLMLDVGLVVGSLLAAVLAGEFKIRLPADRRRYVQSLGGGILMGYGAGIAVGCTIGAFFSAIPSLALNGWVFGGSLAIGAFLGVQMIRRLM
ncbi:MAG: YeeE/YedE family protein [Anaerolineae bacterium]|nr:YeeE/YedE family protein [Anaerolineae bacterium]MDW8101006.1 YeeE/YedE family protein [Anaerolineae bacterium]